MCGTVRVRVYDEHARRLVRTDASSERGHKHYLHVLLHSVRNLFQEWHGSLAQMFQETILWLVSLSVSVHHLSTLRPAVFAVLTFVQSVLSDY